MKKILIISPSLSSGGAERVATLIANSLYKRNYEVVFLYSIETEKKYKLSSDVKLIKLENYSNCSNKVIALIKKLINLRKIIKREKPNYILPFLLDYDIYLATLFLKVPFLSNVRINPNKYTSKIRHYLNRLAYKKAKAILVQNQEQKEYFSKKLQKKVFIMPNPIDESFFNVEKQYSKRIESIVAVGRLENEQKNFLLLLEALDYLHQKYGYLKLDIYGEGPSRNFYENYIMQKKLENVSLCGRVENISSCLCNHDLFVMTSNFEGHPNSLLEAAAIGLPCISTNCPTGPKEIIDDGINGILVETNNVTELINAIEKLINDNNYAVKLGKNAKNKIKRQYSIESTLDSLESALKFIDK